MIRRAVAGVAVVAVGLAASATPAAAHGIGSRGDLPLGFWQFSWGAAAALVVSFALVGLMWTRGRMTRAAAGRRLPTGVDRLAAAIGAVARVVVLALFVLVVSAGLSGADDSDRNVAPIVVYVTMWVGAQVVVAVLGDVWHAISPFETLAAVIDRLRPARPPGDAPGWTPAMPLVGLGGFLWLELCYYDGARPRVLGVALSVYTGAVIAGTWRWGRDWLRRAEGFGVLFGLIGALGVFFRDDSGRLRARFPGSGLARLRIDVSALAVLLCVLGSTTFDGLTGTQLWRDIIGARSGWAGTVVNTIGMAATIAVVTGAYLTATTLAGRVTKRATDPALVFGPSLVPIVVGYSIAHYFSLFVLDGQAAISRISDPFGQGSDWFGTADRPIDFLFVSTAVIAWVQVAAIVVGHIGGVIASHDRALDDERPDVAVRSQYPLLAVMIGYTVLGLSLLLNA